MKTGVWGGTPQKTLSPGGNDYIRKPFSMEELIARIQNILQITQATNPSPTGRTEGIPLGSYRFFPIQQELHLDGEIRKLSHRETQLPGILAAAPNALAGRRDILKKIWGDDSFFNSRNLDVYITHLRDYLNGDDAVEIITLKGVGYRLVC